MNRKFWNWVKNETEEIMKNVFYFLMVRLAMRPGSVMRSLRGFFAMSLTLALVILLCG